MSAPNSEMDEYNVVCPHCGSCYHAESEDFDEAEREETCDSCGGVYLRYDESVVTHHTTAIPRNI